MQDMITFTKVVLSSVAEFLEAEPIIYLFGIVCATFVVKIVLMLTERR